MSKTFQLMLLMICFLSSCSENISDPNELTLTEVKIDLQTGFQNDDVYIRIDDKLYFYALFSGGERFSGPQASFITYLTKGQHEIEVRRLINYNIYNIEFDSLFFEIESADKYWIGIGIWSDSLYISFQDSAFIYGG